MRNSRIRVPETAGKGEIVEIRAMVMHPMENGYTVDSQGTTIPVDIITDFRCRYAGKDVFRVRLEPGLSANPIFTFTLRVDETGPVDFEWIDQHGEVTTNSAMLTVT